MKLKKCKYESFNTTSTHYFDKNNVVKGQEIGDSIVMSYSKNRKNGRYNGFQVTINK